VLCGNLHLSHRSRLVVRYDGYATKSQSGDLGVTTVANLSSLLEDSTTVYPDRTAIALGDTRLTYAQVNAAANQVANLLAEKDIESGDKIALACPNLPYFPIVHYGSLTAVE